MKYLIILILLTTSCVSSQAKMSELDISKAHCKGKVEVVVPGGRCDCVTLTHAIEYEWANKWKDSVGQALFYGIMLNKKAGIVLILRNENDFKYAVYLNNLIQIYKLPIDLQVIMEGE